jgi:hypothetical protein
MVGGPPLIVLLEGTQGKGVVLLKLKAAESVINASKLEC